MVKMVTDWRPRVPTHTQLLHHNVQFLRS